MESIQIQPDRKAQLEEFAKRRGKDLETVVDEALALYLEAEDDDDEEDSLAAVAADFQEATGNRTWSARDLLEDLRQRYSSAG
jgi:predicted transcriptional regulator